MMAVLYDPLVASWFATGAVVIIGLLHALTQLGQELLVDLVLDGTTIESQPASRFLIVTDLRKHQRAISTQQFIGRAGNLTEPLLTRPGFFVADCAQLQTQSAQVLVLLLGAKWIQNVLLYVTFWRL